MSSTDQRPIAHLDRIHPSRNFDDRRIVEVLAEPLRVDRGDGDDQLQVRPLGQKLLEIAEQEIDVQARSWASSMMIVSYCSKKPIVLRLGQQDAVGHQLDVRVAAVTSVKRIL